MHAPVGIHHALARVGRHAGRAHMMIAADRVGRDERIVAPQLARLVQPVGALDPAHAQPFEFTAQAIDQSRHAMLVDRRQPPVQRHARHAQRVALLRQQHPAIGIGRLFGPHQQRDFQLARLVQQPGAERIDMALGPGRRLLRHHPHPPATAGRRHVMLERTIGAHAPELRRPRRLPPDDGERAVEQPLAPLQIGRGRDERCHVMAADPVPPAEGLEQWPGLGIDDPPAARMGMFHEVAADLVALIADVRRQQQPGILDPARRQHEGARLDMQMRAGQRLRLDPADRAILRNDPRDAGMGDDLAARMIAQILARVEGEAVEARIEIPHRHVQFRPIEPRQRHAMGAQRVGTGRLVANLEYAARLAIIVLQFVPGQRPA